MNQKWKETFHADDHSLRFVVMPKGIRLWYKKYAKYAHIDYDLHPTDYQLTEEGRKAVRKLYAEVANKRSHISVSHLTTHMKIPKEKLEYVITKLTEILPANLEEDPDLKKFKEQFYGKLKKEE